MPLREGSWEALGSGWDLSRTLQHARHPGEDHLDRQDKAQVTNAALCLPLPLLVHRATRPQPPPCPHCLPSGASAQPPTLAAAMAP